ncbi:MAG: hypothetical protein RJA83_1551 [Pseudomonadota bacterium]|jgi:hypothetical protein
MYLRLLSILILILITIQKSQAITDHSWSLKTVQDLHAIHQLIAENDPATAGYATLGFTQWYEPGFQQSLKMAKKVNSYAGYFATLRFYTNGFNSEHLNVNSLMKPQYADWPGFIVARRNGNYTVVYRQHQQNDLPLINDQLLNCDQYSPDSLMKTYVLPFTSNGYVNVKTTWESYIPYLFLNTQNPWYIPVKQCTFLENGKNKTYSLHWRNINTAKFEQHASSLAFGPTPPFSIRTFDKSVWIAIPTFQTRDIKNIDPNYYALLKIIKSMPSYRNKKSLVFDLRGNTGGSAYYGHAILHSLYGNDYIASLGKKHILNQTWLAAYRVSPANINFFQKKGEKNISDQLINAAKQHQSIIILPVMTPAKKPLLKINNPVKTKVFLLTDGRCDSSCWLFVREFLQIPNVTLIGHATHFMTPYTYANSFILASGNAMVNIPTQFFIQPADHFGHPFIPSYIYPGYMGDDEALRKWVLQLK